MKISVVLALSVLTAGPVMASDQTESVAAVHRFADAFNKGDAKATMAACAGITVLIDDLPPHAWYGDGACSKWSADFDAFAKANGITPGAVTLGKPRHVDINGQHAYLVIPTTYSYSEKGKQMKQTGSLITVSLGKGSTGWQMTAWAWSDGLISEVKADSGK